MTDIIQKEFKLEVQNNNMYFVMFGFTIIFIIIVKNTLPIIGLAILFGCWIFGFFATDYLFTARFSVIVDQNGMSINLEKKGLGIKSPKAFYLWSEMKSYQQFSIKSHWHIVLSCVDGEEIRFLNTKPRALNDFLTENFPEKEDK